MAFPSYTYTLTNGSTADATQVQQNFSDILNGISDTTKDISVKAITAAGTTTLSGNIILGASTSNTITFNGVINSNVLLSANTSFDIGNATVGLRSAYIGGTSTFTTRIMSAATSSWTFTLPINAGSGSQFLQTDGSGNLTWSNVSEPTLVQNLGLLATVATNALTVALKTLAGNDPSSTVPVFASFRNVTAATGQYSVLSQAAALSIVVPSGATLGQVSGLNHYVWVYLVNDAGTIDIGVSGLQVFDDGTPQSCTQISAGATSGSTLYTTSAHSGAKAIRLIGRLLVNEATAGTWASAPSEVALMPIPKVGGADAAAYTPLFSAGFGTVGTTSFFFARRGEMGIVYGTFVVGTAAGSLGSMTLPTSWTINTAKLPITANTVLQIGHAIGKYVNSNNTVNNDGNILTAPGTDATKVYFGNISGAGTSQLLASTSVAATVSPTGLTISIYFEVPILGLTTYGP